MPDQPTSEGTPAPCCALDTDGDGNCPIHSSPGVLRVKPEARRALPAPTVPVIDELIRDRVREVVDHAGGVWVWNDPEGKPFYVPDSFLLAALDVIDDETPELPALPRAELRMTRGVPAKPTLAERVTYLETRLTQLLDAHGENF